MTVFIGLLPIPKSKLMSSGDYSYGIYLYGFPIAQTLVALWPEVFRQHFLWLLLTAIALTSAFAVLSWHLLEKHALSLKRQLPKNWFPLSGDERRFGAAAVAETGRADR